MTGQRLRCWANIETVLGEWHLFAETCSRYVYIRRNVGVVLGQRRRRFAGIEPAMGCDADPTLNRNWVGNTYRRPTSVYEVPLRHI